ncbi:MAG TPA: NAD(+)/NADH kinase [Clostridia bacterium]
MKIGYVANLKKDNAIEASQKALLCFQEYGLETVIEKKLYNSDKWFKQFEAFELRDLIDSSDIIAVAGGDGTILNVVKFCAVKNKPVLGINIGNVGFLTESEVHELDKTAAALKNGDYNIEYRFMLTLKSGKADVMALNEIVLLKQATARIINFDVYAQDSLIDRYNADGFIVSTPTGSTAYSLSAGGPILSPDIKGIVLTPICSHSLRNRPIVVGENEIINIKVNTVSADAVLIADGVPVENYDLKDIKISKHKLMAGFVKTKPSDFYHKLFTKLNKWSSNKEE